jgi:formylglycine-generating enzyme required for sulfatase activity
MAPIDGFCIDRWEAALVELTELGERPFSPYESVKGRRVRAVSRPGMVPQAYISRNEASTACRAAGKRLCRESEWVRACMGATRSLYPYGTDERKRVCNDSGVSPIARTFGAGAAGSYSDGPMNDPRLNQLPNTVARGGTHKQCVSAEGVYDLVGNLHEWVDDPQGTFLGGYYLDTKLNGPGCRYKTTAHDAAYHDYSTGFRCCSNLGRRGPTKSR